MTRRKFSLHQDSKTVLITKDSKAVLITKDSKAVLITKDSRTVPITKDSKTSKLHVSTQKFSLHTKVYNGTRAVAKSITIPGNYDFYICAHAEIIGTFGPQLDEHHHRQSKN